MESDIEVHAYPERGEFCLSCGAEEFGRLKSLIVANATNFNIDPNRIYLMGHSMGGGGTMHLGIKYPDVWAALAPVAPALSGSTDGLAKVKVPVLVIQGDKDSLVPVASVRVPVASVRRWVTAMKDHGVTHEYVEVAGGGHIDVAFQNVSRIFEFFSKQARKPKE